MSGIVIIGAGQAGSSLAIKLRTLGYEGAVTLIGEEPYAPYQRPPLSKTYLLGEMALERLYLRPQELYRDHNIELRLAAQVTAIDPVAGVVSLGHETLAYDQLALTTGSTPRLLPEAIGGGYIGLEAAAVAAKRGLKVTLVEMAERILQRVACKETSDYFRDLHQSHGVTLLEGVGLSRLTGTDQVTGAILSNGETLDIDFALVGVGIQPNTGLAEAAGLTLNNGIETNALGQTSEARIWAAGDCASFPYEGGRIRLESVPNAIDQAEVVAENMLGAKKEYHATPWFWSDQYDVKLQIAGLNQGFDNVVARKGDAGRSHWYYKAGQLLAVDAMNDPRAYMVAKRLIEAGKTVDPALAADPSSDLKALLRG